jgi:malonate decarboxylase epsilon subunit
VIAFLFPGQGSQHATMLARDDPLLADALAEARAVLGWDLREAFAAPGATRDTRLVQLALLVDGVASARACVAAGVLPAALAGHSVGAFAAAAASGALAFADTLRIVERRGALLGGAFPAGYGMAAIVGLDAPAVDGLIGDAAEGEPLFRSNQNAPRQFALSGARAALERAVARAPLRGAASARLLDVTIPSHCALCAPVASALHAEFDEVALGRPHARVAGNVGGRLLRDARAIVADALDNVAHPVSWADATSALIESGVHTFVEMRPGRVLRDLAAAAFPERRAVALEDGLADVLAATRASPPDRDR